MGLQNATSTYLLKPYERTTHVTNQMADLGSEIGLRIRQPLHRPSGDLLASPDGGALSSAFLVIVSFAAGGLGGCRRQLRRVERSLRSDPARRAAREASFRRTEPRLSRVVLPPQRRRSQGSERAAGGRPVSISKRLARYAT
jgi:Protein of unknown function (DUF1275)